MQSNKILRKHMLYISAPLIVEKVNEHVTPANSIHASAWGSTANSQQQLFSRPIVLDTRSESVQHASRHIEAIAKHGSVSAVEMLREALIVCCSSRQQFPPPQVTLVELLSVFQEHMQYHVDGEGTLAGDYILKSLSLFFICERQEAFQRYIIPLVELGVLQTSDSNCSSVGKFENSRCIYNPTFSLDLHLMPLRELIARFICIFCHQSCIEGGNELIYVSHSRWAFGPKPDTLDAKDSLESPFSPFPEALRRGFLGPLMQFVTSFCIADCKVHDAWGSDCCIVRLDGVKAALFLLTLNNTSLMVMNSEKENLDRCDCPTTVLIGFPEEVPDSHIRLAVQRMLDVIEMREGPRRDFGAGFFNESPEDFRRWCRCVGNQLFYMTSELFFNPHSSASYMPKLRPDWGEFFSFAGAEKSTEERRNSRGFTPSKSHFLNPLLRATPLSRETFALALELRCSFENSILEKTRQCGSLFSTVLLVGSQVILSDCHPYLASLLSMETQLTTHMGEGDLQLPFGSLGDSTFGHENDSKGLRPRLWSQVIWTNSRRSFLRFAWRYLSAPILRVAQSGMGEKDSTCLYYPSVSVTAGDLTLVILLGDGQKSPTFSEEGEEIYFWKELESVCLQELAEREHDMMMLSRVVAERETPQRFPDLDSHEGGPFCVSHDLTTGTPTFLGQCRSFSSFDGTMAKHLFTREIPHAQLLLGRPFCPPRRYEDDTRTASFAFAELPVTRVVLGRTLFGTGKDRRSTRALYSSLSDGHEIFFADSQCSTFRSIENNCFSFLASLTGGGGMTRIYK